MIEDLPVPSPQERREPATLRIFTVTTETVPEVRTEEPVLITRDRVELRVFTPAQKKHA